MLVTDTPRSKIQTATCKLHEDFLLCILWTPIVREIQTSGDFFEAESPSGQSPSTEHKICQGIHDMNLSLWGRV